jgi:integrase
MRKRLMTLKMFRIHTAACQKRNQVSRWDRTYKKCRCPIHVEGTLRIDGFVRACTKETIWDRGKAIADNWEERGTVNAPPPPDPAADPAAGQVSVDSARAEFVEHYVKANRLAAATGRKYATILKQLGAFCAEKGIRFVSELKLGELQNFQATWATGARAGAKKLENLRCFIQFCVDQEWLPENPCRKMHARTPRVDQKEPFTDEEVERILVAARQYPTVRGATEGPKVEAFILLMLYSGLRISDAAFFSTADLQANRASVFTRKNNVVGAQSDHVSVWLPDFVVEKLNRLPLVRGKYFFMTSRGSERLESVTDCWRKKLNLVFDAAQKLHPPKAFTSEPTPHRFRHTFAVRLLQRDVPVEKVADLLGHSSQIITLRHYRKWVPGLQRQLDQAVQNAWAQDGKPKLVPKDKRRITG